MAEKDSPGSVSSISESASKSLSDNEDAPFITIRRHPPAHVFPGEDFIIEYNIRGLAGERALHKIQASLMSHTVSSAVLSTEGPTLGTKAAQLKCRIHMDAVPRTGALLKIRLSSTDESVAPAETTEVSVVIAKLKVEEIEWESPFYKDLGGRDKGQLVVVGAFDANNHPHPENVDFIPTLCYEGRSIPCEQEDFVVLSNNEKMIHTIEPPNQRKFKFRVNSVSKNHSKRNFVVELEAVGRGDIAPVDTRAMEVKSKPPRPPSNGPTTRHPPSGDDDPAPPNKRSRHEVRQTVKEIVANVDRWMKMLVNGMADHQWRIQGHAPNHDGSPDHSRPYYTMPRPNEFFHDAMRGFHDEVQPRLNELIVLVNEDDQTNLPPIPDYPLNHEPAHDPNFRRPVPSVPPMPPSPPMQGFQLPPQNPGMHPFYRDMAHPSYYPPYPQFPHMVSAPRANFHYNHPPPPPAPFYAHASQVSDETRSLPSLPHDDSMDAASVSSESDVEYLLTKFYASPGTQEPLGIPAFASDRSLLGFFMYRPGRGTQLVRLSRLSRVLTTAEVSNTVRALSDAMTGRTGDYAQRREGTRLSDVAAQLAMSEYAVRQFPPRGGSSPGTDHSSRGG